MKVIRLLNSVRKVEYIVLVFLIGTWGCADAECAGYCETACAKVSICETVLDDINMNACVEECIRVSDHAQIASGRTSEDQALHCEDVREQITTMSCDEYSTAMGF